MTSQNDRIAEKREPGSQAVGDWRTGLRPREPTNKNAFLRATYSYPQNAALFCAASSFSASSVNATLSHRSWIRAKISKWERIAMTTFSRY